jgi:hypothetical protein
MLVDCAIASESAPHLGGHNVATGGSVESSLRHTSKPTLHVGRSSDICSVTRQRAE